MSDRESPYYIWGDWRFRPGGGTFAAPPNRMFDLGILHAAEMLWGGWRLRLRPFSWRGHRYGGECYETEWREGSPPLLAGR